MNDSVLGLGAGGWQVWSLHDSVRSVSQEAYKWGKETMMENKRVAALEMRGSLQPPGHNALMCCSSSLSHLYTVIQWDHIHAPGLQILIAQALPRDRDIPRSYVHEAELVPHWARVGLEKRQPPLSVSLKPLAEECLEGLIILAGIRHPFKNALYSHHTHSHLYKILSKYTSLVS